MESQKRGRGGRGEGGELGSLNAAQTSRWYARKGGKGGHGGDAFGAESKVRCGVSVVTAWSRVCGETICPRRIDGDGGLEEEPIRSNRGEKGVRH